MSGGAAEDGGGPVKEEVAVEDEGGEDSEEREVEETLFGLGFEEG